MMIRTRTTLMRSKLNIMPDMVLHESKKDFVKLGRK